MMKQFEKSISPPSRASAPELTVTHCWPACQADGPRRALWDSDKVCTNCTHYYNGVCLLDDKRTNPNNYCSSFHSAI